MALGIAPIGSVAIGAFMEFLLPGSRTEGTLTTIDTDLFRVFAATTPFITLPTDTPGNSLLPGTLQKPASFQRSIINSSGYGSLAIGVGEMELINSEADYDSASYLYGIDGRRVVLKLGSKTYLPAGGGVVDAYDDFDIVMDLTATGWQFGEDILRIDLRDNSYNFEVPTQPNTYGGTGGLDGTADLKGKRIPLCLGQCSNITPVFLIPGELILQSNDGAVQAITAVYDSGAALTFSADYASGAALRAAAPPAAGSYSTSLAGGGLIRLGATPAGLVTADVKGVKDGSTYISTTADIVKYIILNACHVTVDELDLNTFNTFNTIQPAVIGYYLNQESNETVAETLSKLMTGVGGWCGFTMAGLLEIRRFNLPGIAPIQRYNQYDYIGPVVRQRLPAGVDPIVRRIRVGYDNNFTVQDRTQLVGSVTDARAAYLIEAFRIAATSDELAEDILDDHPLAHDPDPIRGWFVALGDAQAEANRLMDIYGTERASYTFSVKDRFLTQELGDTIFIQHTRFGLTDGKYLTIVELREDLENNITQVTGFG